jgi:hypothetical protein
MFTALVQDTSDTCTKSTISEPELSPATLSEASGAGRSGDSTSSLVSTVQSWLEHQEGLLKVAWNVAYTT